MTNFMFSLIGEGVGEEKSFTEQGKKKCKIASL